VPETYERRETEAEDDVLIHAIASAPAFETAVREANLEIDGAVRTAMCAVMMPHLPLIHAVEAAVQAIGEDETIRLLDKASGRWG
jgi:hypothetical protein